MLSSGCIIIKILKMWNYEDMDTTNPLFGFDNIQTLLIFMLNGYSGGLSSVWYAGPASSQLY
ncbi:MAG TPA: hypothetical protein VD815_09890 [Candidatus Saccharimonadales bacterium]|nr:hypothetical protein [Candidatus Saccharimonadales bacterium]